VEVRHKKPAQALDRNASVPPVLGVGNDFPSTADWKQPGQLDDEQLASLVAEGAMKVAVFCEALKPFYLELRERFRDKKSKEALIYGCKSWDEYCEKVLDRTRRAINYWLAGGNPGNEKTKEERKSRADQQSTGTGPQNNGETREVAEDLIAKLRDEMEFEAPQPPIKGDPVTEPVAAVVQKRKAAKSDEADGELDRKARWFENEFRKLGMLNVMVASAKEAGKFDLTYLSIDGGEIEQILQQCGAQSA
jgi:hypothetical protein